MIDLLLFFYLTQSVIIMLFYFEGAKRGINKLIRLSGGIMVCDFLKIEVFL